jgi:hypothetical protein
MIFLAICMTIIYFHVLKQEKKVDKYSASFSQKKRKQSILRYFEEGVPLTQSFKRTKSSFFTSLKNTVRKRRTPTKAETQVSCDERNVESGEKGAALEVDDDVDVGDKEEGEGTSGENKIDEGDSSEDDEGNGEKDGIDELECIVEA